MTLRTVGGVALGVFLAFGSGWCVGASGRTSLALDLAQAGLRADVAEVRASALDARVSLSQSNFGDARRALQRASVIAERVQLRLRDVGQADRASGVQTAIAHLAEADRLSGALDPERTRQPYWPYRHWRSPCPSSSHDQHSPRDRVAIERKKQRVSVLNSESDVLRAIRDQVDHPATAKELLQTLDIPREQRATFKRHLRSLVNSGALVEIRGERFGLPDRMNLVVGRVSTNPRGFAFVDPEAPADGGPSSIFIAGTNLNQAMHGDRVVVRIEHRRDADTRRGPHRAHPRARFPAHRRPLRRGRRGARVRGAVRSAPGHRHADPVERVARRQPGEMVTAEISRWPTATRPALGRIVEVIGPIDAPGVDTR